MRRKNQVPRQLRAVVEPCETRFLFAAFVVNTTSDVTNPSDGLTTFREAITAANATTTADTITFAPAAFPAATAKVITLKTTGVTISAPLTITGSGQSVLTITGVFNSRLLTVNATSTLSKIAFKGNTIGGGIENKGTLVMTDVTVADNISDGRVIGSSGGVGGGIRSTGSLRLTGCTFTGNKVFGSNFSTSVAARMGTGGALSLGATTTIEKCSFSNNTATGGTGKTSGVTQDATLTNGAIARGGAIHSTAGTLNILNSTFKSNSAIGGGGVVGANGEGGALSAEGASGDVFITSCTFSDNAARGGVGRQGIGGALDLERNTTIKTTTIENNQAVSGNVSNSVTTAAQDCYGGGIFFFRDGAAPKLTVERSTISGNTARGGSSTLGSTVTGFGGNAMGGGLFVATDGAVTLTNCTITGNAARAGNGTGTGKGGGAIGGGIVNMGGSASVVAINNSTIARNIVAKGNVADPIFGESGGGLFGGKYLLKNSIVCENTDSAGADDIFVSANALTGSRTNLIGKIVVSGGGASGITNNVAGNKIGISTAGLGTLAFNGGPTKTMLLLSTSVAINAGEAALLPAGVTVDQRGLTRVLGGKLDIGAVELK